MPRYKLHIAYDGTGFCGWQRQEPLAVAEGARGLEGAGSAGGDEGQGGGGETRAIRAYSEGTPLIESRREGRVALRTVQGVIEAAVRQVVREDVEVLGASRTDSGVHARGQVAAFTCEPREVMGAGDGGEAGGGAASAPKGTGWPLERGAERLMMAVNSRLPGDVVVVKAEAVDVGFDPIGDVTSKGYSYTFHVGRQRPLWDRNYVHHVWHPAGLDVAAMNDAAGVLVGEHDFAAFAAAGHGRLSTVRRVFDCRVVEVTGVMCGAEEARRVRIEISGSGFLWNMVRIIAGTLMQVGIGQRGASELKDVLEGRDRTKAGPTAGPEGLCLEWIRYGEGESRVATGESRVSSRETRVEE